MLNQLTMSWVTPEILAFFQLWAVKINVYKPRAAFRAALKEAYFTRFPHPDGEWPADAKAVRSTVSSSITLAAGRCELTSS
jgi:hypothetical protein